MNLPVQRDTGTDDRVAVYLDGFNFYHGLMAKGWGRYRWLDYHALVARRILVGQTLVAFKYFTSVVNDPDKAVLDPPRRQPQRGQRGRGIDAWLPARRDKGCPLSCRRTRQRS